MPKARLLIFELAVSDRSINSTPKICRLNGMLQTLGDALKKKDTKLVAARGPYVRRRCALEAVEVIEVFPTSRTHSPVGIVRAVECEVHGIQRAHMFG